MGVGVWMKDEMGRRSCGRGYTYLQGPRFWFTSRHHVINPLYPNTTYFGTIHTWSCLTSRLTAVSWFQLSSPKSRMSYLFSIDDAISTPTFPRPHILTIFLLSSQKKFLSSTQIFDVSWAILSHHQLCIMYFRTYPLFFRIGSHNKT